MRVLWIVNTIFPDLSKALGMSVPVIGGWMYGLFNQILQNKEADIAVATVHKCKTIQRYCVGGVIYYLIPCRNKIKYQKSLETLWKDVIESYVPDIVHIHGTEYPHGLACINSLKKTKYVISIQGLVSVCERYYYAGLSDIDIIKNITIRDIIRKDTIFHGKNKFIKRGECEKESILKTENVIGRTDWDRSHSRAINASVNYYHCNEILRDEFYCAEKWNIKKKKNNTIFLSQASYPIKGLHQVLKAVFLIKKEFPKIKIRIAGDSIIKNDAIKNKLSISGYGLYIKKLIKKLNIDKHVLFLGPLTAKEMINEYRNAHVFICPSSIENSPNSVGEAQILGVPTIASNVGGIQDMVKHSETGILYPFNEVEMLANYIRMIFRDDLLASNISAQSVMCAEKRHCKDAVKKEVLQIYQKILSDN